MLETTLLNTCMVKMGTAKARRLTKADMAITSRKIGRKGFVIDWSQEDEGVVFIVRRSIRRPATVIEGKNGSGPQTGLTGRAGKVVVSAMRKTGDFLGPMLLGKAVCFKKTGGTDHE